MNFPLGFRGASNKLEPQPGEVIWLVEADAGWVALKKEWGEQLETALVTGNDDVRVEHRYVNSYGKEQTTVYELSPTKMVQTNLGKPGGTVTPGSQRQLLRCRVE